MGSRHLRFGATSSAWAPLLQRGMQGWMGQEGGERPWVCFSLDARSEACPHCRTFTRACCQPAWPP